ncbi:MAG TPA: ATP-binding protein [candidate division Zixibacteria bacterium]|nr:ATP-binding protein [candidate division Zixibacteria bacterium]
MNIASIPTLVTALLSLSLGLFVLTRNRATSHARMFALWCFLTAYWQGSWTVLFNVQDRSLAELVARIGYSGIIFIPIVFFHFVVALTRERRNRRLCLLFYSLGVAFLGVTWVDQYFVDGVYRYSWGYYPRAGTLHVLYLLFLVIMLATGLRILVHHKNVARTHPVRVNQLKYIIFSTVIYSLAGVDFLGNYGIAYYPIGLIFTNAHAGIIAYAIIQYRLLDISVVIKRSLIYALILFAMLIPCFVIVIGGQLLAFGSLHYGFTLILLGLLTTIGFVFPKLRFMTEDALEKALFNKKVDYRETLLRSSREMVAVVDMEALSQSLVQTVARALAVEKAALYLLDDSKDAFARIASRGMADAEGARDTIARADPIAERLSRLGQAIVMGELQMAGDDPRALATARRMEQLEAEISVPIVSKGKLIGILNLGHKEGKEIYSSEDIELLSTLANQAAIAIENARLYQNLKQSQDTLRRADRLSSLGLLTAGLAHEIRNPLVAIRTFTQLLPERYDDPEFREGFQGLALKEVDRICGLINDLLSFARPSRPNVAEENINDVVDSITRILETEAKEKNVEIIRNFTPNLPKVWIDREQMKQVFMNLVLNAIQAIKDGGAISVATRLYGRSESGEPAQFVQVEVRDTGVGIPEENLDHIFDPFFTSKDEGSGLGLSISHQIVQEHGGFVTVESKVGKGTSFFVNLPVGKPMRSVTNGRMRNEANFSH